MPYLHDRYVNDRLDYTTFTVSRHAQERLVERGISPQQFIETLCQPEQTYPGKPGQRRLVRGDLCVIVDETRKSVPTVHFSGVNDPDAQAWLAERHAPKPNKKGPRR